jgi:hypothetical protein
MNISKIDWLLVIDCDKAEAMEILAIEAVASIARISCY